MKIAYTMTEKRGDTDLLLAGLAAQLESRGAVVCGTVQINTETGEDNPCDMDVKVLPSGQVLRISQALGAASRGCRLDPQALETAVGYVQAELAKGADVLIVNKFGKHEAEGRGFREIIADALSMDIPVLVGLNALNKDAFEEFSSGEAVRLPPVESSLLAWIETNARADASVA
ncbi:DUF2478 domain-containing protein [Rhodospirillaceae bacterium KN72]|uniref:DUF2478 domain-containing protein n=1 Tax=Pacificispira spongiicola TaxID=2729598 RepID=A0A7Y0HFC8_9PROT|nr:DUF2478 domain-containing protein [Pacificispira spongiicola]NMM43089.1 DUF2478 domain-containing protein [Pacificispira spongiicola]